MTYVAQTVKPFKAILVCTVIFKYSVIITDVNTST